MAALDKNCSPKSAQSGAALIVALVLLGGITIIGLSNMQSSTLEMKMINSQAERQENFAIAESALTAVETFLSGGLNLDDLDLYTDDCSDGKCFETDCTGGLCFAGSYENASGHTKADCEVAPTADVALRENPWEDESIWEDATYHRTISVDPSLPDAKYIIEFLCFIGVDHYTDPTASSSDPLFRITVLYEASERAQPIMLQSTYSFEI